MRIRTISPTSSDAEAAVLALPQAKPPVASLAEVSASASSAPAPAPVSAASSHLFGDLALSIATRGEQLGAAIGHPRYDSILSSDSSSLESLSPPNDSPVVARSAAVLVARVEAPPPPPPPIVFNESELALLAKLQKEAARAMADPEVRGIANLKIWAPNYVLLKKFVDKILNQQMEAALKEEILQAQVEFLELRKEQIENYLKPDALKSNPAKKRVGRMLSLEELQAQVKLAKESGIDNAVQKFLNKNHEQSWRWTGAATETLERVPSAVEAELSTTMRANVAAFRQRLNESLAAQFSLEQSYLLAHYNPASEWERMRTENPRSYSHAFGSSDSYPGAYRLREYLPQSVVNETHEVVRQAARENSIVQDYIDRVGLDRIDAVRGDTYAHIIDTHRSAILARISQALNAITRLNANLASAAITDNTIPLVEADARRSDAQKAEKRRLQDIQDELLIQQAILDHYHTQTFLSYSISNDSIVIRRKGVAEEEELNIDFNPEQYGAWFSRQFLCDPRSARELRLRMLQAEHVFIEQALIVFRPKLELAFSDLPLSQDLLAHFKLSTDERNEIVRKIEVRFKAALVEQLKMRMPPWISWEIHEPSSEDSVILQQLQRVLREKINTRLGILREELTRVNEELTAVRNWHTDRATRRRSQLSVPDALFMKNLEERFKIMVGLPRGVEELDSYKRDKLADGATEEERAAQQARTEQGLGGWLSRLFPGVRLEAACLLLRGGVPINALDRTPLRSNLLHVALANPSEHYDEILLEICTHLISLGVKVNEANTRGLHPTAVVQATRDTSPLESKARCIANEIYNLCVRAGGAEMRWGPAPDSVPRIDESLTRLDEGLHQHELALIRWERDYNPLKFWWKPRNIDSLRQARHQLNLFSSDPRRNLLLFFQLVECLSRSLSSSDQRRLGIESAMQVYSTDDRLVRARTAADEGARLYQQELLAQTDDAQVYRMESVNGLRSALIATQNDLRRSEATVVTLSETLVAKEAQVVASSLYIAGLEERIARLTSRQAVPGVALGVARVGAGALGAVDEAYFDNLGSGLGRS